MSTKTETFRKTERLCSRKTMTLLFEEGNVSYSPYFKIVWIENPSQTPFPAQVAFGVPKKGFRRAVDRNILKRRMREAYRKKKQELYDSLNAASARIAFIIIFRDEIIPDYLTIEKAMGEMLDRLVGSVKEKHKNC